MLPKLLHWLRTQTARLRQAYNSLDVPPLVRMGLLIAAAAIPFIIFAVFQSPDTPQTTAAQQEPADLRQQVPLRFPFGNLEASPSPSPSPSPTESPSPRPTRSRRTAAPPPPAQPPAPVAQAPEPSPSPEPPAVPASESPSPSPSPKPPSPSQSKAPAPPPPPPPSGPIGVCNDGKDNDDDGKIDMDDPGCFDREDDDE